MFIDASVMLANLLEEPEARSIREILSEQSSLATSAIAMFEASNRLAAVRRCTINEAYGLICSFADRSGIRIVDITAEIGQAAHACASRYHHATGHPARLNMGDCFAYAAAAVFKLRLAYKGNDFVHTDIDGVRFGPSSRTDSL